MLGQWVTSPQLQRKMRRRQLPLLEAQEIQERKRRQMVFKALNNGLVIREARVAPTAI
jgi:hypothetical protein